MLDKNRHYLKLDLTKQYRLEKITFRRFRHLDGLEIDFGDKAVTGIFGANGLGKSSILAVIRCLYQAVYNPRKRKRTVPLLARPANCKNEPFGHLFYGNQFYDYNNSEIVAEFSDASISSHEIIASPLFEIKSPRKRWTPGTSSKPARAVYYINMETCIPVSEAVNIKSEREKRRRLYKSIVSKSSELGDCFNKIFLRQIGINDTSTAPGIGIDDTVTVSINNKQLPFRELSAGEQRVLKLLDIIFRANDDSIILIDEIETTLHPLALDKLISVLNKLAKDKRLQIIFTSHSFRLAERKDINVRTLYKRGTSIRCDHGYNQECRMLLEGTEAPEQVKMLGEDIMSKSILMEVLRQHNKLTSTDVRIFGGYNTAFKLASSLSELGELNNNIVFVLDGDVVISYDEKLQEVENAHIIEHPTQQQKEDIAKHFIQYNLPSGEKLDSYIYNMLKSESDMEDSIVAAANGITEYTIDTVPAKIQDKDRFLEHYKIQETVTNLGYKGEDMKIGYQKIIEHFAAKHAQEWNDLTRDVQQWINRNM